MHYHYRPGVRLYSNVQGEGEGEGEEGRRGGGGGREGRRGGEEEGGGGVSLFFSNEVNLRYGYL